MNHKRTRQFKLQFAKLPQRVIEDADKAFLRFKENPANPVLHNHALKECKTGRHRPGSFSVWVNVRYRALYIVDGDDCVWYWIGSHEEYNNFTGLK